MNIDATRFESCEYETELWKFWGDLHKRKGSAFTTLWMEGVERASLEAGQRAARDARLKYTCTYFAFEPALCSDFSKIERLNPFMKRLMGFEVKDITFGPVIEETRKTDVGVSKKIWHVFVNEAHFVNKGVGMKGERYCLPRVTARRLEVLERMMEIHCQDGLRSGHYDAYVVKELQHMGYYEEANMVARLSA